MGHRKGVGWRTGVWWERVNPDCPSQEQTEI